MYADIGEAYQAKFSVIQEVSRYSAVVFFSPLGNWRNPETQPSVNYRATMDAWTLNSPLILDGLRV
jgi:hypothetical protein